MQRAIVKQLQCFLAVQHYPPARVAQNGRILKDCVAPYLEWKIKTCRMQKKNSVEHRTERILGTHKQETRLFHLV